MNFDIPLHIENNTPEARLIESIVSRDHVSPEEAVKRALRGVAIEPLSDKPDREIGKNPGELLFGLYADEPGLMQRIAQDSRIARDSEIVKGHNSA